jgi:hypothetical protein
MKTKKSVTFLLILLAILIIIDVMDVDPRDKDDYGGELSASIRQQNLSIFVLPAVPIITITSPESKTYSTTSIFLNYSIKNSAELIWYNLDNAANITITNSIYFTASEGSHTLYLFANNTEGLGTSNISFSVQIGTPGDPGSPGGPGGPGVLDTPTDNETTCQESWTCAGWSQCSDNKQQRTCADTNNCNQSIRTETQACTPDIEIPGDEIKLPLLYLIILIILLVVIMLIIINRKKIRILLKKYKIIK